MTLVTYPAALQRCKFDAPLLAAGLLTAKSKISSRHNISAIEVKSGKNYTLTSLKKFMEKYNEQLNVPYVLHTSDLMEKEGIVYLPLYMTPLL